MLYAAQRRARATRNVYISDCKRSILFIERISNMYNIHMCTHTRRHTHRVQILRVGRRLPAAYCDNVVVHHAHALFEVRATSFYLLRMHLLYCPRIHEFQFPHNLNIHILQDAHQLPPKHSRLGNLHFIFQKQSNGHWPTVTSV